MRIITVLAAISLIAVVAPAGAQTRDVPPANAKKLSEIVAKVEQRADFAFIDEVDWDNKGYEVTYFTKDGAKVEIKFDPVTAAPMNLQ
ncbi:MAG TPA: PepSY domain-containing protein [Mesorhizobium sp.]|jgi:hypothetical protein|uniref:PepSY domain-containing protein n=1 Tax=Mesorhizobium sp. TaxID=1871066 RepID=UPI002DDCB392|nr:PepSY domain-containing protein [Mesorhizobium sp.]HEV2502951.1 PepSY domain-containing protein [Mesorhizobium sp.]